MPKVEQHKSLSQKLKIQIGVCKRMIKEVVSYEKEVVTNQGRIQKMRDDNKDIYDIRKQEEVLQESLMMVPDSKNRLEASINDLKAIMEEEVEGDEDISAFVSEANAIIAESNTLLEAK